jgi:hypothetical protein
MPRPTITRLYTMVAAIIMMSGLRAMAQNYIAYQFIFSGTAYQTNASGDIVATPITDQTLLQSQGQNLNITNLSTISLVYHFNGGPPYGDTVDVISNATGETLVTEFGFYFGSDLSLGRYAVTNATQNEQRRVDQIYTFSNTTYTYQNGDSLGTAFTHKHTLTDTNGNTLSFVEGTLAWDVIPTTANAGPMVCVGHFTLGKPMF